MKIIKFFIDIIKGIIFGFRDMIFGVGKLFAAIGRFIFEFGKAFKNGDWKVKLSVLFMGFGHFTRHEIIKGVLIQIYQIVMLYLISFVGFPYLAKFNTLGTVEREVTFDLATMKNIENDYDNSFLILLFSIITILAILALIFTWMRNVIRCKELMDMEKEGKHINNFREDLRSLLNEKFHVTLLSLPIIGIITFNVVPLCVLIAVAFTNYDKRHLTPTHLFTWVGFDNFKRIFTSSITSTFGYSFRKILVWTLVWAVVATFTTYFGGIFLAMFINNKDTKLKKLWRTIFVVSMAVPQFVSLLLVKNMFKNQGIVNTLCAKVGITGLLYKIHLIPTENYIPFLTNANWAKFTIIMINIWVGIPYLMMIATGILMNIPSDIQESARIDGATKFQAFRKITMPYILNVTAPYLVTSFVANINNFNVIFLLTDDVYVTTDQKLANSSAREVDLLITWLYRLTQDESNYKMASVIGILVFIICTFFTLIAFKRVTSTEREETFQ